jgi:hypothetical protein
MQASTGTVSVMHIYDSHLPVFIIQSVQLFHKAKLAKADPSQGTQLSLHEARLQRKAHPFEGIIN